MKKFVANKYREQKTQKQVTLLKGLTGNLAWLGMVRFGLVWFDWFVMLDGYCLDVIPCKIWKPILKNN